ncbi:MAG: hypothetical protein PHI44_02785 [Candidatus Ratteibacteria bacterium]|nr:hypothetical protein [Candidatus Ratteibacteria bacterium]
MGEIKLKVDGYTKFILTVIAVALLGLLFSRLFTPPIAKAGQEILDVNIAKIDGYSVTSSFGTPIKVKVVK